VPLHTLRADIDYAQVEAFTTFGRIGVKVWIYRGEVLPDQQRGDGAMRADRGRERPQRGGRGRGREPRTQSLPPSRPAPALEPAPEAPAVPAAPVIPALEASE
jgi:small subunit ribosomal protein S3